MKKQTWMVSIGLCIMVLSLLLSVGVTGTYAQECRIIRIDSEAASTGPSQLYLEPLTVWVQKGDCVVWFNKARDVEVRVIFEEGKTCKAKTDSPVSFELKMYEEKMCFVTDYIKMGGTSSLRFVELGEYEYKVDSGEEGAEIRGSIVVKE